MPEHRHSNVGIAIWVAQSLVANEIVEDILTGHRNIIDKNTITLEGNSIKFKLDSGQEVVLHVNSVQSGFYHPPGVRGAQDR